MLVTKQPVLRMFWYPVIPIANLQDGPKPFTLLEEKIVLWLDESGNPAAAMDQCCHRSAQLSLGTVENGAIACPYHGWQFDRTGNCVHIPQSKNIAVPSSSKIKAYKCKERYGYVWVCLDEPITEIPTITEAFEPNFRLIPEFYEPWKCAGLRVMENEFDFAHPTFVHTGTFGSKDHPTPELLEITETIAGLKGQAKQIVVNTELQQQNIKMDSVETYRIIDMEWFMPFTIRLRINYSNGLAHVIVNTMTPIDDANSQMVQFCLRNDTEADSPTEDVIAFDRAVTLEDKRILETTNYDVPLVPTSEQNMYTDKPGLIMRKKLMALLKAHGETEQTRS